MSAKQGFFSFGFKLFLCLVLGLALSDAILYYITDHTLSSSYYDALVILSAARHTTFALSVTLNAIIHLGVLLVIFIASLVMSNRIAGPMYRFEKVAGSVKDGDLSVDVSVRQNDFMKSQAADFNVAVSAMCNKLDEVRESAALMRARASELDEAVSGGWEKGRMAELVHGMKSDVGAIKDSLSFFKT